MNPVDRLLRILKHEPVDRPPVAGLMVSISEALMGVSGVNLPEAHHDPRLMVRLAAAAHEHCGLESLKVPFDMTVEAGAAGAEIDYGGPRTLPRVKSHPFQAPAELAVDESLLKKGRMPAVFEALRLARREYGERAPVVASIVGPFTLAAFLFGMERLMIWMVTEPETYGEAMARVARFCGLYGKEQLRAGAHVIQIADPSASGDLLSPSHFASFVKPALKAILEMIGPPCVVHICGNITRHLPHLAGLPLSGVSFDEKTEIGEALKWLKGKAALIGYVPTSLLREGTPEEVSSYSRRCLDRGVDVLSAGCAWPLETPTANVEAMVRAGRPANQGMS
jgi:[methyl-Co(III) methanol-specific corrinoid protein]:coenzyme M methyltransferase